MTRKELGIKAKGFIGGELTGMIISAIFFLILVTAYIFNENHIAFLLFAIFFLAMAIWTGYLAFSNIKKPRVILEYDRKGLYIKGKTEIFVPYHKILKVIGLCSTGRYNKYTFGVLHLTTTDGKKYKVGVIYDVEEVERKIKNLMCGK